MRNYKETLIRLLEEDLDFHDKDSSYSSHNFHSFPAKFPPQLPRKFISNLTQPGDLLLDPMMGSGTTVLEAFLTSRKCLGFDIDPLAVMLTSTKITTLDATTLRKMAAEIIKDANNFLENGQHELEYNLLNYWDESTEEFINYWFAEETQYEIAALIHGIKQVGEKEYRRFFELALSAIIITKSGGVSLAFDLAHTRPHRAKVAYSTKGDLVVGEKDKDSNNGRIKFLTKKLKSPVQEFEKRVRINIEGVEQLKPQNILCEVVVGDSQELPLIKNSVDLIVTSPPYASNAIDYMRAHKFSLVWFGYDINYLGGLRKEYIGGEAVSKFEFEELPKESQKVIDQISAVDQKKGLALHRYYSEMTLALREMYRVLKPGKSAIVVVGNSIMRGVSTETDRCLVEIGQKIGFEVPKVGIRNLDRNRRMLPSGNKLNHNSQIQQRMHEEYVIGFYKPMEK